jgi:hypothetical protein
MFKTRRIKDGELYSDIFWNTKWRMGLIGCSSTSYCMNRIIKYECISPRIVKLRSLNIHSNNTRRLHSSWGENVWRWRIFMMNYKYNNSAMSLAVISRKPEGIAQYSNSSNLMPIRSWRVETFHVYFFFWILIYMFLKIWETSEVIVC